MDVYSDNMPNVVWIWDVSSLYSREVTFRELTEDTCSSVSPMVVLIHKEGKINLPNGQVHKPFINVLRSGIRSELGD
jgi:hypothetical protein